MGKIDDIELFDFLYLETKTLLEQCGYPEYVKRIYDISLSSRLRARAVNIFKKLYNQLCLPKDNIPNLMFQGFKFFDVMKKIQNFKILVWSRVKDIINSKFNIVLIPSMVPIGCKRLNDIIFGRVNEKKINFLINRINKKIDEIKRVISRASPKAIILTSDLYPMDRAVILVAREMGVPTILSVYI